jgi:hypothetical protein
MTFRTPEQELTWIAEQQKIFGAPQAKIESEPPTSKPEAVATKFAPTNLTEKETIEIVKNWVSQDSEVKISERRTFEEMV